MQVRAEATRRTIVDAAVELFDTVGYGNTPLADLIAATAVSKGAFYYHFSNKQAVAEAIIAEADAKLRSTALTLLDDPSSRPLAGLIRAIFVIAELERTDPLLRVGVQLRGGLSQISPALEGFAMHRGLFRDAVATAITDGDIQADLDVDRVAHTLWTTVLGNHQHCGATGEHLHERLSDVLSIILPAICTPEAAPVYLELVDSVAGQRTKTV